MKTIRMLKKIGGILALVIVMGSCSEALPPFALTKGITKDDRVSDSKSSTHNKSSTNNNNSSDDNGTPQAPGKPDLVVVSLKPGSGMPVQGKWEVWEAETYENGVIATIKNEGAADVTNLFKVGVYMYYRPDVYYYTNKIGSVEVIGLKAGETKEIPIAISIPNNANIGKNNYIGFYVDDGGNIEESDENNNKGGYNKAVNEYQLGGAALHLLEIHENRPDIVAESFTPPSFLKKGVPSSASVTIKNTGHRDVLALFKVGVYMYYEPYVYYYTNKIGSVEVTDLKAGETKELTVPLVCNNYTGLNENWYIGVYVDCDGNITEMDRERKGDSNYNQGGYNGNTGTYEPGELLKTVYYSK